MHDDTVTRVPLKRGSISRAACTWPRARPVEAVSAESQEGPGSGPDGAAEAHRRFGVEEPVVQKAGDARIVVELAGQSSDPRPRQGHSCSGARSSSSAHHDKTDALEKVLPGDGPHPPAASGSRATPHGGKPSAVEQLLGGDSTKRGAKPDSAAADSGKAGGGILTGLIQSAGAVAGPPRRGSNVRARDPPFPRVDKPDQPSRRCPQLPRGVVLRWSAAPTSIGVQAVPHSLRASPTADRDRQQPGGRQRAARTSSPGASSPSSSTAPAGASFGEETGRHVANYMAIILDGRCRDARRSFRAATGGTPDHPRQQEPAGGPGPGLTLKAGALPIPLKIVEERQVGASSEATRSARASRRASSGTAMVILIHAGLYRMSGALAVVALALYILFTLGGLSMINATLTLPGLAGIVLSVGIAVDGQRADLRAASARSCCTARPSGWRWTGVQARDERHHRLQRQHGADGAVPLPVRHRAGEGVRGHADHGHRSPPWSRPVS